VRGAKDKVVPRQIRRIHWRLSEQGEWGREREGP
jgi:hypothetical protein